MPTFINKSAPTVVENITLASSVMADSRPANAGKAVVATKVNGTPAAAINMQSSKKVKGKKPEEPVDNARLVQQAISQIESKQAGDREQDLEIGAYLECS
jgi:hypothetical protein